MWRRHLRHFERLVAVFATIALPAVASYGQSGQMMNLEMPQMPTIAVPTLSTGFYTPSSNGFSSGIESPSAPVAPAKGAPANAVAQDNASSAASALSQKTSAAETLKASDISALNGLGLFGSISDVLGANNPAQSSGSPSQTAVLNMILAKLGEIKEAVGNAPAQKTQVSSLRQNPKILRFSADGVDYLPLIKSSFFSSLESDGTFLLTGDIRSASGEKMQDETFYFLFKSAGIENGVPNYSVETSVSQRSDNPSSFFRRLSERGDIIARRTGNLVTMRVSDGIQMDLLLALDN